MTAMDRATHLYEAAIWAMGSLATLRLLVELLAR